VEGKQQEKTAQRWKNYKQQPKTTNTNQGKRLATHQTTGVL